MLLEISSSFDPDKQSIWQKSICRRSSSVGWKNITRNFTRRLWSVWRKESLFLWAALGWKWL